MTDKPKFDLYGETRLAIINEPVVIEEEPKAESATARAIRRWFKSRPIGAHGVLLNDGGSK